MNSWVFVFIIIQNDAVFVSRSVYNILFYFIDYMRTRGSEEKAKKNCRNIHHLVIKNY